MLAVLTGNLLPTVPVHALSLGFSRHKCGVSHSSQTDARHGRSRFELPTDPDEGFIVLV
jgi:hypothetical protein